MRSPSLRFTVVFVAVVLLVFGAFLISRRQPVSGAAKPVAVAEDRRVTPLEPAPVTPMPQASPRPGSQDMPDPPDVNGLNFSEIAIPGAKLDVRAPVAVEAGSEDYVAELTRRKLVEPITGLRRKDLVGTFHDKRSAGEHEAIDIMEPQETPVHAIDEGNIVKLFTSKRGGLTIYQFDDARRFCYYYAHLYRYADGIKEGMLVRSGDVIGYVGMTGDAPVPHLHFAISRVGPDQKWWVSTPLDPYPVLLKFAAP